MHTRPLQQLLPRLCRRAALPASWTPVPRSPMSTDVQQQQQPLRSCENTAPSAAGSGAVISSPAAKVARIEPMEQPLRVMRLSDKAVLPVRGSAGAAGYDLASAYDYVIPAHGKELVKTDLAIHVPHGTYGRVAPRSGLAAKHFIDTGAGVIDEDYRGNVMVLLFNHSNTDFAVKAGDRVAQLLLERIATPDVVEVASLEDSQRGAGGFGSTGVSNKV